MTDSNLTTSYKDLDYYEILNCKLSSSVDEIKASYYKLAKLYHPDKRQVFTESMTECYTNIDRAEKDPNDTNMYAFHLINEAYTVLSDTEQRTQYDHYRMVFQTNQHQNIGYNAESININEFTIDNEGIMYRKPCRCGDNYEITNDELKAGYRLIQCSGCSLYINIEHYSNC